MIYTGYVPYENMPELYAVADIGVVPSLFNDPFNLTSVEYLANGIPTILSDMGAMKELVNTTCSIIVKSDHYFVNNIYLALLELLQNNEKREQMGKCAGQISTQYSKEKYCANFEQLIREFVNNEYDG